MTWLAEPAFEANRAEMSRWILRASFDRRGQVAFESAAGAGLDVAADESMTVAAEGISADAGTGHLAEIAREIGIDIPGPRADGQMTPTVPHTLVAVLRAEGVVVAVRDPTGRLPLFWARDGARIVVSADSDEISEAVSAARAPDPEALISHLTGLWRSDEETFLAGVRRVPAGHALVADSESHQVVRVWDPFGAHGPGSRRLGDDEFLNELERAVGEAAGTDPTGIYLSGGLDSVSIAALATTHARAAGLDRPKAYSIGFGDSDFDEIVTQKAVASQLGMDQTLIGHEELCEVDPVTAVLELASTLPAPPQNFFLPGFLTLGRLAVSHGALRMLTGTGGDEWLGVSPALAADLLRRGDLLGVWALYATLRRSHTVTRRVAAKNVWWVYGVRSLGRSVAEGSPHRWPSRTVLRRAARRRRQGLSSWIAPGAAGQAGLDERVEAALQAQSQHPGTQYAREIGSGMTHPIGSTEAEEFAEHGRRIGAPLRHPFLDPRLVTLLCQAAPRDLNGGSRSKAPLRRLLGGAFPELDFETQRKPIAANYVSSLVTGPGVQAYGRLGGLRALGNLGVVDPVAVDQLAEAVRTGRAGYREPFELWELLCLEAWARPRQT